MIFIYKINDKFHKQKPINQLYAFLRVIPMESNLNNINFLSRL